MNDKIKLFTALTALAAMGQITGDTYIRKAAPPPTPEEIQAKAKMIAMKKGLLPFKYGDTTIYSLNQRTADKKARKLNLI